MPECKCNHLLFLFSTDGAFLSHNKYVLICKMSKTYTFIHYRTAKYCWIAARYTNLHEIFVIRFI